MNNCKKLHCTLTTPVLVLVLTFFVAACGPDPQARLRPLTGEDAVLAFGDSLTFGTGARPDESYPQVLSQLTGLEVINAGVPGELSGAGRARIGDLIESHRPALVVLCHGGNDILRRTSRRELKRNLEAMIDEVRAGGADVVLIGVPQFGLGLSPAPEYAEVANALDVPVENEVLPQLLASPAMKSDTVHPNARGYRQMASAVAELLRREGAL